MYVVVILNCKESQYSLYFVEVLLVSACDYVSCCLCVV